MTGVCDNCGYLCKSVTCDSCKKEKAEIMTHVAEMNKILSKLEQAEQEALQ